VNFVPNSGELSANEIALGSYISRAQAAGANGSLVPLVAPIVLQPTMSGLAEAYDAAAPSTTLALESTALLGNLTFSDALLGCRDASLVSDDECSWGQLGGATQTQFAASNAVGFAGSSSGFSGGYERRSSGGPWSVGAGLRYAAETLGTDGGASSTGAGVSAGLVVERNLGAATSLATSVTGGSGVYATSRTPILGDPTLRSSGNAHTTFGGLHVRLTRRFTRDATTTLAPFVDAGVTLVKGGALTETGAGGADAQLNAHAQTYASLESGVHLEHASWLHGTAVRPALDLSVTQLAGNRLTTVSGTLAGAPAGTAPFVLSNKLDPTILKIAPSLTIAQKNQLDFRVGASYGVSAGSHAFNAFVQIGKKL
jgi:hypothetical protein